MAELRHLSTITREEMMDVTQALNAGMTRPEVEEMYSDGFIESTYSYENAAREDFDQIELDYLIAKGFDVTPIMNK